MALLWPFGKAGWPPSFGRYEHAAAVDPRRSHDAAAPPAPADARHAPVFVSRRECAGTREHAIPGRRSSMLRIRSAATSGGRRRARGLDARDRPYARGRGQRDAADVDPRPLCLAAAASTSAKEHAPTMRRLSRR